MGEQDARLVLAESSSPARVGQGIVVGAAIDLSNQQGEISTGGPHAAGTFLIELTTARRGED